MSVTIDFKGLRALARKLLEACNELEAQVATMKAAYGEKSTEAAIVRSFLRRKKAKLRFLIYICNKDIENARAARAKLRELRLQMFETIYEADANGKSVRVDFEGAAPSTTAGEAVRQLADEIKAHDGDEEVLLDALEGVLTRRSGAPRAACRT